ncbi:MAG TPA: hypothetical protein PK323_02280 [Bacteroidia bacterium]|nr:hypothetical protein [Bacteroidia bacterium]
MNSLKEKPDFTNIAASEIFKFKHYELFRRKDGILQAHFYSEYNGEIEDAINIVETFKILKEEHKCLVLLTVEDGASFTKEAREFVASAEVSNIVMADAFVINSMALKILMNGYLKFNKPTRPTKFFNSAENAVAWLKEFNLSTM